MRYFDKDFFKFTFGFLCIVAASLLVMLWVSNYVNKDNNRTGELVLTG